MKKILNFFLNGQPCEVAIKPKMTLIELIREEMNLMGSKIGCNAGACGACTVLIDGKAVNGCSVLAMQVAGKNVETVEGLAEGESLHPLQEAFLDDGGYQCGFCTPGMLMAGKSLLNENPAPTKNEVRHAISGNLCRCTGYVRIIDSIYDAGQKMQKGGKES